MSREVTKSDIFNVIARMGAFKAPGVKETIVDIGLPNSFIQLIWECINTSNMRILWNEEALEKFYPTRGVR